MTLIFTGALTGTAYLILSPFLQGFASIKNFSEGIR